MNPPPPQQSTAESARLNYFHEIGADLGESSNSSLLQLLHDVEKYICTGELPPDCVVKAIEVFTACCRVTGILTKYKDVPGPLDIAGGDVFLVQWAVGKIDAFVTESTIKLKLEVKEIGHKLKSSGLLDAVVGDGGKKEICLKTTGNAAMYVDVGMLERWDRLIRKLPLRSAANFDILEAFFKAIEHMSAAVNRVQPWLPESWSTPDAAPPQPASADLLDCVSALVVGCFKMRKYVECLSALSKNANQQHLRAALAFATPNQLQVFDSSAAVSEALEMVRGIRYPGEWPFEGEDGGAEEKRLAFYEEVLETLQMVGGALRGVVIAEDMGVAEVEALWPLYMVLGRYVRPLIMESGSPVVELVMERGEAETRGMGAVRKWVVVQWGEVVEVLGAQIETVRQIVREKFGVEGDDESIFSYRSGDESASTAGAEGSFTGTIDDWDE
ncbi:hypothetical protein RUND412_005328 [Rhizina undulata]